MSLKINMKDSSLDANPTSSHVLIVVIQASAEIHL